MPRHFEIDEDDCIGCSLCSERAPENMDVPAGAMVAKVVKQPETQAEEEACVEAAEYCPTGGLRVRAASAAPASSPAEGTRPPLAPAGHASPAGIEPHKLEN